MDAARRPLRLAAALALLLAVWPPPLAQAASLDTVADHVLGQTNFTNNAANEGGGITAHSLYTPLGLAFDAHGNLYVADAHNNRVLEYDDPLTTDHIADRVFGQADFTHGAPNAGGSVSAQGLDGPGSLALDPQGNLYVADFNNNRVVEYDAPLTSDATADHVFGQLNFSGHAINAGGLSASSLNGPSGLALDKAGNLYVADFLNSRVLEFDAPLTSDHVADLVFGQPGFITADVNHGGISAASLGRPASVALDAAGNVYIADHDNNRVLEYHAPLTTNRTADLVFGQGGSFTTTVSSPTSATSLRFPGYVTVDARGNLYVSDGGNARVLEYNAPLTSDDTADHLFGQPNFGASTPNNGGISASRLALPESLALDPLGNLFVVDLDNNRVLGFDLPLARGAPTLTALSPNRLAAGGPALTLTVTGDTFYGDSVVRWNGSPRPTTYLNSTRLTAALSAADVAAGGPFAVTVFTPAPGGGATTLLNLALYARGAHDTSADLEQGQPNLLSGVTNNPHMLPANQLNIPAAVAVNRLTGRLFVADTFNNRVLSWPNAAALANGQAADLVLGQPNFASTVINANGRSARSLDRPYGVAVDTAGNLYVADRDNHRVLEYTAPLSSGMAASHVFGQGGSFIVGVANNGGASANSLNQPWGVALDDQDNLYVADAANYRVLEYDAPLTSDRTADRVFGQQTFATHDSNHGGLSASSLSGPLGVALDPAGNLYVADNINNRVLEYNAPLTSDHAADRVFGQPNFTSSLHNNNGPSASSLWGPEAVALDGWGNLYVADYFNNRVLAYNAPLANSAADRVFGQLTFTAVNANHGGSIDAAGLDVPAGVALDGQNNLYIADLGNSRVLEYDWALTKLALPLLLR